MLDGEIIDLYLKREPDAIRHTSEKYGSRLLVLSNRLLQDMETAKECENDTYLQAWERIPPNEPREYFFAFLAKHPTSFAGCLPEKEPSKTERGYRGAFRRTGAVHSGQEA